MKQGSAGVKVESEVCRPNSLPMRQGRNGFESIVEIHKPCIQEPVHSIRCGIGGKPRVEVGWGIRQPEPDSIRWRFGASGQSEEEEANGRYEKYAPNSELENIVHLQETP